MNFKSFLNRKLIRESQYVFTIAGIVFDVDPLSVTNNNGYALTSKDPNISITVNKKWVKPIINIKNAEDIILDERIDHLIKFLRKFKQNNSYDIDALIKFIDNNMPDAYRTTNRIKYRQA